MQNKHGNDKRKKWQTGAFKEQKEFEHKKIIAAIQLKKNDWRKELYT